MIQTTPDDEPETAGSDEGPLDPSVFDGLFDDLGTGSESPNDEGDEHYQNDPSNSDTEGTGGPSSAEEADVQAQEAATRSAVDDRYDTDIDTEQDEFIDTDTEQDEFIDAITTIDVPVVENPFSDPEQPGHDPIPADHTVIGPSETPTGWVEPTPEPTGWTQLDNNQDPTPQPTDWIEPTPEPTGWTKLDNNQEFAAEVDHRADDVDDANPRFGHTINDDAGPDLGYEPTGQFAAIPDAGFDTNGYGDDSNSTATGSAFSSDLDHAPRQEATDDPAPPDSGPDHGEFAYNGHEISPIASPIDENFDQQQPVENGQTYDTASPIHDHHADVAVEGEPAEEEPQHDERPTPNEGSPPHADSSTGYTSPARPRRVKTFAVAIIIGAVLGLVGAAAIGAYILNSGDSANEANQNGTDSTDGATGSETGASEDLNPPASLDEAAASGGLELTSIRFEPGTTDLTPAAERSLSELASIVTENPENPITITVRTYSESTAASNQELSVRQAQVIADRLMAQGVAAADVETFGIGAPPLSSAQPVPNFVAVEPGFGQRQLDAALDSSIDNPFAIGIDPVTNKLRYESIESLTAIGELLVTDPSSSVTLAGYAFRGSSEPENRKLAAEAVNNAATYLVTTLGVAPDQLQLLNLGPLDYIVGPESGGHITVNWGASAEPLHQLADIDQGQLVFPPGSSDLGTQATATLDQVVDIVETSAAGFVIDVHTYSEDTEEENDELSRTQATAIGRYLTQQGLTEDQVRVFGSGDAHQFRADGGPGRVVITALPVS